MTGKTIMSTSVVRTCTCLMITIVLLLAVMTPPPAQALGNRRHNGKKKSAKHTGSRHNGDSSDGENNSGSCGSCHSLPDPTLMGIPAFREKMIRRKMVYWDDRPHFRWIVERINHSDIYENYCPEVVYGTLVTDRRPLILYHKTCDRDLWDLWSEFPSPLPCLTSAIGRFSQLCKPHTYYRIVTLSGQEKYQEVLAGCTCSVTSGLSKRS